jgi:hypothetical protein
VSATVVASSGDRVAPRRSAGFRERLVELLEAELVGVVAPKQTFASGTPYFMSTAAPR